MTKDKEKRNANPKTGTSKRESKYDKPMHIDATMEEVAQTIFSGKPKPKDQWRFLKEQRRKD